MGKTNEKRKATRGQMVKAVVEINSGRIIRFLVELLLKNPYLLMANELEVARTIACQAYEYDYPPSTRGNNQPLVQTNMWLQIAKVSGTKRDLDRCRELLCGIKFKEKFAEARMYLCLADASKYEEDIAKACELTEAINKEKREVLECGLARVYIKCGKLPEARELISQLKNGFNKANLQVKLARASGLVEDIDRARWFSQGLRYKKGAWGYAWEFAADKAELLVELARVSGSAEDVNEARQLNDEVESPERKIFGEINILLTTATEKDIAQARKLANSITGMLCWRVEAQIKIASVTKKEEDFFEAGKLFAVSAHLLFDEYEQVDFLLELYKLRQSIGL